MCEAFVTANLFTSFGCHRISKILYRSNLCNESWNPKHSSSCIENEFLAIFCFRYMFFYWCGETSFFNTSNAISMCKQKGTSCAWHCCKKVGNWCCLELIPDDQPWSIFLPWNIFQEFRIKLDFGLDTSNRRFVCLDLIWINTYHWDWHSLNVNYRLAFFEL